MEHLTIIQWQLRFAMDRHLTQTHHPLIPAFYRNRNSCILPITEIGNGSNGDSSHSPLNDGPSIMKHMLFSINYPAMFIHVCLLFLCFCLHLFCIVINVIALAFIIGSRARIPTQTQKQTWMAIAGQLIWSIFKEEEKKNHLQSCMQCKCISIWKCIAFDCNSN